MYFYTFKWLSKKVRTFGDDLASNTGSDYAMYRFITFKIYSIGTYRIMDKI